MVQKTKVVENEKKTKRVKRNDRRVESPPQRKKIEKKTNHTTAKRQK